VALVNTSVADITADTLLSQSKTKIKGNDDKLLANDVAVEARLVTAESNITTLTAQKAPLANPTFTGTVTTPKVVLTPEGGIAISLLNKTGVTSVKGSVVSCASSTDNAFILQANEFDAIGVVYQSGIADGSACLVVVSGIAEVLLKNTTASTRGYWVKSADTDGRADATTALPTGGSFAGVDDHFKEIGHCLETKVGGTDVLAKIVLHMN
jgi:hypothetical protein